MLRILILLGVSALLALADGPVLQTGQTLSYDVDGNVVPYGSIKDDGYYRAGAARSYDRIGDLVMDNVIGLQWQDNIESVLRPWYKFGAETAANYCTTLSLGGHTDWRLPMIEEFQTLVDYSQHGPAATEDVFNHISSYRYWSSTTSVSSASYAWIVDFNYGYSHYGTKTSDYYVRCVRGGQFEPSNLSRDSDTKIVTDNKTGLQWQDNTIVVSTQRSWIDAINYCEDTLDLGAYSDWRLPNLNELLSIVNFFWYDPALNTCKFQNYTSSHYWSSTTYANHTKDSWLVYFADGNSFDHYKADSHYVRCVRGGQINVPVNPAIIMYLLN